MVKVLLLIALTFILQGCGTPNTKANVISMTEKEYVYTTIPSELLEPIIPDRPMSKEEYLKLTPPMREKYMASHAQYLLLIIKKLDIQLKKIEDIISKQKQKEKPEPEKKIGFSILHPF